MWIQLLCACVLYSMGHVKNHAQIWAIVTSISHMGEMRDSDWSREILLRSDWLGLIGAIMTTTANSYLHLCPVLQAGHLFQEPLPFWKKVATLSFAYENYA